MNAGNQSNRKQVKARVELAKVYLEIGDYDMGNIHATRALKLSQYLEGNAECHDFSPVVLTTVAMVQFKLNKPRKAYELLMQALEENTEMNDEYNTTNYPILLELGKVCSALSSYDEGLEYLSKVRQSQYTI